jgi:hypothetical protein
LVSVIVTILLFSAAAARRTAQGARMKALDLPTAGQRRRAAEHVGMETQSAPRIHKGHEPLDVVLLKQSLDRPIL